MYLSVHGLELHGCHREACLIFRLILLNQIKVKTYRYTTLQSHRERQWNRIKGLFTRI